MRKLALATAGGRRRFSLIKRRANLSNASITGLRRGGSSCSFLWEPGSASRDIDQLIESHLDLTQSAEDWEASIEATAAQGTLSEKLERLESLRSIADGLAAGLPQLLRHTSDSIYATETPETAASVLALFDHLERMQLIAAEGAELLEEHL